MNTGNSSSELDQNNSKAHKKGDSKSQFGTITEENLVDMTNTMPGKKKKKNLVKVNPNVDLKALFG